MFFYFVKNIFAVKNIDSVVGRVLSKIIRGRELINVNLALIRNIKFRKTMNLGTFALINSRIN